MIRAHVLICGGTGCTSSGSDKIQEAFEKELRRVGVFHGSQVFLTPFYPVQRQEILNSWRRNLLIPPEELAYLQAALWRLKKEWLVN